MVGTQGVLRGLLHTGLRAVVVKSGTIRAGDPVRLSAVAERLYSRRDGPRAAS